MELDYNPKSQEDEQTPKRNVVKEVLVKIRMKRELFNFCSNGLLIVHIVCLYEGVVLDGNF